MVKEVLLRPQGRLDLEATHARPSEEQAQGLVERDYNLSLE